MSLKRRAPKQEASASNVEFTNLKHGGEYEGRLVYVADLGLQDQSYYEKPPAQQLSLGIEILGETVEVDGKPVPRLLWTKPFNIFHRLTEKGNEIKYYSVFDSAAMPDTDADWDAALGEPCNVTIENVKGKGANEGKLFDNIKGISAIPSKYRSGVEEGTMTPAIGDADDEENEATKALYGLARYIWDKREGAGEAAPAAKKAAPKAKVEEPSSDYDSDEDVPF